MQLASNFSNTVDITFEHKKPRVQNLTKMKAGGSCKSNYKLPTAFCFALPFFFFFSFFVLVLIISDTDGASFVYVSYAALVCSAGNKTQVFTLFCLI